MASELSVSVNTVNTHVRNIYAKLQARDRSSAVQRARELRLLSAGLTRLARRSPDPVMSPGRGWSNGGCMRGAARISRRARASPVPPLPWACRGPASGRDAVWCLPVVVAIAIRPAAAGEAFASLHDGIRQHKRSLPGLGACCDSGILPHARGRCNGFCTNPLHNSYARSFCTEPSHVHLLC
ncbi:MAG TPA: LuxR C-terminal-related transcriptional regulator [Streptosporangiaceae bacterium]